MNLYIKNKQFFSALSLSVLTSAVLYADVSGVVFQDLPVNGTALNSYGVKDSNEFGVGGITVTAYPDNISTITDENGAWSLATTSDSRIEFSNIPSYLKESVEGGVKNASVQFVVNGETSSFALHNPADYVGENNSILAVTNIAGNTSTAPDNPTLRVFSYAQGTYTNDESNVKNLTTVGTTGSTWGLAYDNINKKAYTSALLRRHVDVGPEGLGAIYVTDLSDLDNPSTILFTQIDNPGTEPTDRDLAGPDTASHDANALVPIAKVGLGDIDLSEDRQKLYTINLNTQELVEIDVATKVKTPYSIDNPFGDSCAAEDVHSWAVEPHNGAVYVGSVCSSDPSVGAAVSKLENGTFSTVFTTPLTYTRGKTLSWSDASNADWKPWNNTLDNGQFDVDPNGYGRFEDATVAQPILSDIVFTENSGMVLGFIDRTSLMTGYQQFKPDTSDDSTVYQYDAGGDTLRVCKVGDAYVLEGEAGCDTHDGYDGTREYFIGDFYAKESSDSITHEEISLGGLLYKQGSNAVATSAYDPVNYNDSDGYNRSGMTFFNMETGDHTGGQLLNGSGTDVGAMGGFAKTGGMGDIELLSAPAPIEIGDRVWNDSNANGVQDVNELGISEISVELLCGGAIVSTATTDADGNYIFSNNPNGTSTESHKYNVTALVAGSDDCLVRIPNVQGDAKQSSLGENILTPANIGEGANSNINDSDGILNGDNAEINVTGVEIPLNGANNHSFDFGFSLPQKAKLGDFVWEDLNKNGIQDEGEPGVPGVTVTLKLNCTDANETLITDSTGHYLFENIEDGDYCVRFDNLPEGYVVTTKNAGTDDSVDSDVDGSAVDLKSEICTLGAGDVNLTHDLGIYNSKVSIGDKVWNDSDRDGIQDANEEGIKDVTAVLYESDCATEINTTVTNESGFYLFDNLDAGDYCVGFRDIPLGYQITQKDASRDDAEDSDVDPLTAKASSTNLEEGENDMSWDMGIYKLASLGDRVWYDDNQNGKQDDGEAGVADVDVTLLKDCDTEVNSTRTDNNGLYLFSNLEPADYCVQFSNLPLNYIVSTQNSGLDDTIDSDADSSSYITEKTTLIVGEDDRTWDMGIYSNKASIGDRVWYDNNENGIQDLGEDGVEGVKVVLYQSDCNTSVVGIAPVTTNASGNYRFTDLTPAVYCVGFDLSTLPIGYTITDANIGDDDNDSDVDPISGKTSSTTLDDAEVDMSWDMGIHQTSNSSIGNLVWHDINANGIQDEGEQGVADINVTLYKDCNAREIQIASITTDFNGFYLFDTLYPGDYCLEFSDLPLGAHISKENQGVEENDSDVNASTLRTMITTIESGENDQTWDMGIYYLGSLGNKVWEDSDRDGIQEQNEQGVQDVNVTLYSNDCTTSLAQVQTDANGSYLFENLMPENYCIEFSNLPMNYVATTQNRGDDNNDSDVDSNLKITNITLSSQENNMSFDMGIHQKVTTTIPPAVVYTNTELTLTPEVSSPVEEVNSSIPEEESEEERIIIEDQESGLFRISDDEVEANTEGSVTTIHVLENDDDQALGRTIRLIAIEEGETLWNNGTAVAGTNIETTDELYVEGEGTWQVVGGDIIFTADEGFDGVPTPIYYAVLDENGNSSNIAQVTITSPCVCDPYVAKAEDSVASLNLMGMGLMLFLLSIVAVFFIREELALEKH